MGYTEKTLKCLIEGHPCPGVVASDLPHLASDFLALEEKKDALDSSMNYVIKSS
jgi:hypothetical protein